MNIEEREREERVPELERDRPTYFISRQDSRYEELKGHVDLLNDTSLNLDNLVLLDSKRRRLNVGEFQDDEEEIKIESKLSPFMSKRQSIAREEVKSQISSSKKRKYAEHIAKVARCLDYLETSELKKFLPVAIAKPQ